MHLVTRLRANTTLELNASHVCFQVNEWEWEDCFGFVNGCMDKFYLKFV